MHLTEAKIAELHELSPEPEYNQRDYFDEKELEQEIERKNDADSR